MLSTLHSWADAEITAVLVGDHLGSRGGGALIIGGVGVVVDRQGTVKRENIIAIVMQKLEAHGCKLSMVS